MRRLLLGNARAFIVVTVVLLARVGAAQPRHGISLYGDMHYPPDFKHFDYTDPHAPKGGMVRFPGFYSTFNSLNGFIRKGTVATGMLAMDPYIYDRLTAPALDEPATRYGLLAKTIELSPDGSWVEFVLRPEARWHDGRPVTADDVVFSFDMFKTKSSPSLQMIFLRILRAEKRGPLTVRFYIADPGDRQLPLVCADMIVLPRHYWQKHDFERATLEPPLGSGPYRVGRIDPGRTIEYDRVPDYWGRDLPVNVGRFNFDRIRIEHFMDTDVELEAVKAGLVDVTVEAAAKTWARGYEFPAARRGHFLRAIIALASPAMGRTFEFNTRLPKFQDVRVRKALAYAYDRERTIHVLGNDFYRPSNSFFQYSDLAHRGPPSPAELALLEPLRDKVPKEVFEAPFAIPPTHGRGRNRDNLRVAAQLLRDAGYVLRDGTLVDGKTGAPFTIDFIFDSPRWVRYALHYADALHVLGIATKMRVLDSAEMLQRMRSLDFEALNMERMMSNTPNFELRNYFSSAVAMRPNTFNLAGVRDPAVDSLIASALTATTREDFVAACRALDRVLLYGYYAVDMGVVPGVAYAYWNRFGKPGAPPRYATGFPHTWWFDPDTDAKIRAGLTLPVAATRPIRPAAAP